MFHSFRGSRCESQHLHSLEKMFDVAGKADWASASVTLVSHRNVCTGHLLYSVPSRSASYTIVNKIINVSVSAVPVFQRTGCHIPPCGNHHYLKSGQWKERVFPLCMATCAFRLCQDEAAFIQNELHTSPYENQVRKVVLSAVHGIHKNWECQTKTTPSPSSNAPISIILQDKVTGHDLDVCLVSILRDLQF